MLLDGVFARLFGCDHPVVGGHKLLHLHLLLDTKRSQLITCLRDREIACRGLRLFNEIG